MFLMLYELEFTSLSDEVMTMLQGFAASFSSTNINQDLFNHVQAAGAGVYQRIVFEIGTLPRRQLLFFAE